MTSIGHQDYKEKKQGGVRILCTQEKQKITLWGPYAANLVDFSGLVVFNWFILRGKEYFGFFLGVIKADYDV